MKKLLIILILLIPLRVYSDVSITRITHPNVNMKNHWQGEGFGGDNSGSGPWNFDDTRIIIYETTSATISGQTGRGAVWGCLTANCDGSKASLITLGGPVVVTNGIVASGYDYTNDYDSSIATYISNTTEFPDEYALSSGVGGVPVWSLTEDDTVYALNTTTKNLVKYNVDTTTETVITSYNCDVQCSTNPTVPQIVGWSTSNTLIVSFSKQTRYPFWDINISTDVKTYYGGSGSVGVCSAIGDYRPYAKYIHSGRSLDKKYRARYNTGAWVERSEYAVYCGDEIFDPGEDSYEFWDSTGASKIVNHCQWSWDDDYYVCSRMDKNYKVAPYITSTGDGNYQLWKVAWERDTENFTYTFLLQGMATAGYWCNTVDSVRVCGDPPGGDTNYHGLITPTVRNDNNEIMILATNGIASWEDNQAYSTTPYKGQGMFLLNLDSAVATTLSISEPDGDDNVEQADNFNITYTLADSDTVATVTFYYDTDNSGYDGTIVADGACQGAAEGTDSTCTWDTGSISPNTYYIYGITSTGEGNAYSSGSIVVRTDTQPTLSIADPDGANDEVVEGQTPYTIVYTMADTENVATVGFYYDANNSGLDGIAISDCQNQAEGTGSTCDWNTSAVSIGDYYVYGIADDGVNPTISAYSSGVMSVIAPVGGDPCDSVVDAGTYWEALDYTGSIEIDGSVWTEIAGQAGKKSSGNVLALTGGSADATCVDRHDGKEYEIFFPNTGTYDFYVRGYATGGGADSVWYGTNGVCNDYFSAGGDYNQWAWKGVGTMVITSTGTGTINIWGRETDYEIDLIFITANGNSAPNDGAYGTEIDPTCIPTTSRRTSVVITN